MSTSLTRIGRIAVRFLLGLVLLLSGIGKLLDPTGAESLVGVVMGADSVFVDYATLIVYLVTLSELVLVGWLAWGRHLMAAFTATFVLVAIFTFVVGSIVMSDQVVATCGCFGALGLDLSAEGTLVRNLVLLAIILTGILLTDASQKAEA
ncbi:hypothetical protein CRI94_12615 [Longibacter salinarum]|uniref:Methylamine utilisation protein MauE domain-containing protein n=1 Tax=Longibacter salinarum TaxID=1850348 RepID=A0A2A8CW55_9BACT|nr:MauE/DoxX family redox-associated membrane protein [Longibacter salinarum]PEN12841.1 hypothetical protein CRI94_12615 [Longibacter salinarum]